MKVEGTKELSASRDVVWSVLNDPAQMAKLMPGVEGFEIQDDRHWQAKVKIPLGLGGLRMTIDFDKVEERPPEFAQLNAKGNGVGAIMNMQTQFHLSESGTGTSMRWEADVKIAGPVGAMGQRVLQPIINQQVGNVLSALEKQVSEAAASTGGAVEGVHPGRPRRTRPTRRADAQHRRQGLAAVAVPFRIGVMQLTMEPLDEMLESARVMDEAGMDTVWLAEAYPWWRKHQMEARSSTVVSALMARETERLTIGWGIISPFTRHPVQVAMDARVVQEAAGPGRFILGFGTSKIFLNNAKMQTKKTLGPMRDAVEIVRGVLGGEAFEYEGDTWSASVPALSAEAHTPRDVPPVYVAATAPKMQALAAEIADGCLTPSITTPAFVRYTRENVAARTSTSAARSSPRSTRTGTRAGTARARSRGCISPTRFRTSRAPPTRCSISPASSRTRSGRSRRRWSRAAGWLRRRR